LEKDLRALIKIAENNDYEPYLLRAVLQRNDRQTLGVISKLKEMTGYLLYEKIITVLGLSFKPGTSDVRNSLALRIVAELGKEGATVRAHDPLAIPEAMALQPNVEYYEDPYEATRNADALLILTEWPEYRTLDYGRIKSEMGSPILLDSRNLLDPGQLRSLGFTYYGIGRS
jgi:UDPglucose 6-dehydrogenase